ncbi:IdgA domain protein [Diplocarpon rosae]|nr:IdgA domain protein [Diplocarpon rosae]
MNNQPVVALETTIYTHGFPYPENVSLALDLEEIVRQKGAVPATIGILNGEARVGLSNQDIIKLASAAGKPETMKVSRRDIPYILGLGIAGRKLNGGTTVSGTMMLARRAGIKVFGTGGIGGVHRGVEDSMDISADLTELGRTSIAVISSGCKSFLDIQRTLEYLETQGATVCTFADGREGDVDFPAFYTRDSGVKSHGVVQTAREAAAIIYSQELFGDTRECHSGMLFANPIPTELSIPKEEIDAAINQAVREAAEQGFHGHANTPFILSRIKDLTKGNSLPANRALIESNVAMAASVAVELCKFRASKNTLVRNKESKTAETGAAISVNNPIEIEASNDNHDIHVLGSVAVDLSCDYTGQQGELTPQLKTSNIATIVPSIGGVGHNVALAAHRAGGASSVQLCSFIADDLAGKTVLAALKNEGLDISGIETLPASSRRTAQYVAINDAKKDLVLAMADMSILVTQSPESLTRKSAPIGLKWAVVDANWQKGIIRKLISHYSNMDVRVAFEPVSVAKSAGLFEYDPTVDPEDVCKLRPFPDTKLDLATPNQHELAAMHAAAKKQNYFESDAWWHAIDAFGIPSSGARDRFVSIANHKITDQGIPQQAIQLLPFIPTILTKLGAEGVLVTKLLQPNDFRLCDPAYAPYILSRCSNGSKDIGGVYMRLFPAFETVDDIVSVNGVGDTFLGVLVAGLAKGLQLGERLINVAQKGAVMTLRSKESVSPQLTELSTELDNLAKEGACSSISLI